jgi:hypothetical protein
MRADHGHRHVAHMTRDRINEFILGPLANKPGAGLDTLKKLRILIRHAIKKGLLDRDGGRREKRFVLGLTRSLPRSITVGLSAQSSAPHIRCCHLPICASSETLKNFFSAVS